MVFELMKEKEMYLYFSIDLQAAKQQPKSYSQIYREREILLGWDKCKMVKFCHDAMISPQT